MKRPEKFEGQTITYSKTWIGRNLRPGIRANIWPLNGDVEGYKKNSVRLKAHKFIKEHNEKIKVGITPWISNYRMH
jgi:hypothetical protein